MLSSVRSPFNNYRELCGSIIEHLRETCNIFSSCLAAGVSQILTLKEIVSKIQFKYSTQLLHGEIPQFVLSKSREILVHLKTLLTFFILSNPMPKSLF